MPVVRFGEAVLFLPLKIASGSKGGPPKKLGFWLGTIERTEETSIGTTRGVIKCRTVSRLSDDDKWNGDLVNNMMGVPWQQVPGRDGQHIPLEWCSPGVRIPHRFVSARVTLQDNPTNIP